MKITQKNYDHLQLLTTFDRIPVLSTISSLTILIFKLAPRTDSFNKSFTAKAIDQIPVSRCLILLIPVFGNMIVLIMDANRDSHDKTIKAYLNLNNSDLAAPLIIEELRFGNKNILKDLAVYQIEKKYYAAAYLTLNILDLDGPLERALNQDYTGYLDLGLLLNHVDYIQLAADKNIPLACWEMGRRLENTSLDKALEYYHKGAAGIIGTYGVAMCQYKLGMLLLESSYLWKAARALNEDAVLELLHLEPYNKEAQSLNRKIFMQSTE